MDTAIEKEERARPGYGYSYRKQGEEPGLGMDTAIESRGQSQAWVCPSFYIAPPFKGGPALSSAFL